MSNKKIDVSKSTNLEKDDERILYGVENIVCFACGEKINSNTDICPYCKITIK